MATKTELATKFNLPGVRFEAGEGGLTRIAVATHDAEAQVYLHGAHVAHYQPRPQPDVLFVSGKSWFEKDKPIRGGVPICFPWFGVRADDPKSPNHGFVRLREWTVESIHQQSDGGMCIVLLAQSDAETRKYWPHDFELRHRVTIGKTLTMTLATKNTGREPFTFEQALHTYFAVGDVRQVSVTGLENTEYITKVEGLQRKRQGNEPLRFASESDFVFQNTTATCIIDDPVLNRRITIEKSGSRTTVVWNPWTAKAKAMPDFGDDEWPGMLCVETCAAGENAVRLEPGKSHELTAKISVESV